MKAKYINESNNKYSFERKENKLSSLGIGQITLIEKWLDEMNIYNYIINKDLTINVNNSINIVNKNLIKFPEYIQFNKVIGYFNCVANDLISLRGCPKIVDGSFWCHNNQLESLEGCPKIVKGNFICTNNKIEFKESYVRSLCKVKGKVYV